VYICHISVTKENVRITGSWSAILKTPPNATAEDDDCPIRLLADYCIVDGVAIDGNAVNNQSLLSDQAFTRYADGVAVYANYCRVINCKIENVIGHGIIVWGESFKALAAAGARNDIIIENNLVKVSGLRSCIDIASTGTAEVSYDIFINKNVMVGTDDPTNEDDHGFTCHAATRVFATDNIIRDCARGLNIHTNSSHVIFKGGEIKNCRVESRVEINSNDCKILYCSFFLNPLRTDGSRTTIHGCYFMGNGIIGSGENIIVTNNTFNETQAQIRGKGSVISGNRFYNTVSSNGAIYCFTEGHIVITNNIIINAKYRGIHLRPGTDYTIVSGNVLKNISTESTDHRAIELVGVNYFLVSDNIIDTCPSTVVRPDLNCNNGNISGNIIKNFRLTGVDANGCNDITLFNNRFLDGTVAGGRGILVRGSASSIRIENNEFIGVNNRVELSGTEAQDIRIIGNRLATITIPAALTDEAFVKNNIGYITEARGTDEIIDTGSAVDVTHGLAATPTYVNVTPRGDESVWVSSRTASTFTVSRSGTSGALAFDWKAEV